jgi:Multiubiquitin
MESHEHDRKFGLTINGHEFKSPNQFITGKEILVLAGLDPEHGFEILMKLTGKEYEPVELDESKDLNHPGIENFEVKPIHKLTIWLDDEEIPVPKCFLTPVEILALGDKKPEQYYLKQILEHREINYKEDEHHLIAIVCKMKFSTCKKGPVGVS